MKTKVIAILFLFSFCLKAQINTITTAVPFLMITPDARAGGMGETGVATSPNVYSMHWNAAQLAFVDKKFAVGISYTPWLRALVPNINHAYVSFYYKPDSINCIGISMRYFSMGTIMYTNNTGMIIAQYSPKEFAFDGCYSRRFAKYWSAGIAARYIYSDLTNGILQGSHPGTSIAADLSIYYHDHDRVKILGKKCTMMLGMAATNIGSKISYVNATKDFIPINFRLGQGVIIHLDSKNDLTIQYDFNKLLVPSPPRYEMDSATGTPKINPNTGRYIILAGKDPNVSVPKGMVQSFSDAPGGVGEEFSEINFCIGMEYCYNRIFTLRIGYFYEAPTKGNRQFVTLGAGIKFHVFGLDFAYLIPTNGQRSPLQNTLRFSLQFEFDKSKKKK